MASAQDILNQVLYDILEDPGIGPILGIVTVPQLIDILNLTITDFLTETGMWQVIFTSTVQLGVGVMSVPDQLMRVDDCFLAGALLGGSTITTVGRNYVAWRYAPGYPLYWHTDQLPPKTIELLPPPNYTGTYIPGTNEPDPPHGQFGSFSITDGLGVVENPQQHQGLTMVGPAVLGNLIAAIDPIFIIPDDFALSALGFGVLQRLFSGDNELKDLARADFCRQQYLQIVATLKMVLGEPSELDQ